MVEIIAAGLITALCWALFLLWFNRDRSRYRNCYLLWIALLSTVPFILSLAGPAKGKVAFGLFIVTMIALLFVPFFLIYNGIVMIRREGKHLAQLLSLVLGIVIFIGEAATAATAIGLYMTNQVPLEAAMARSPILFAGALFSITIIYGCMCFLIFMIYILFMQMVPPKKDFDYVIIHGSGLLNGDKVSKLLQDRLDKAIEVYRMDPSPTKLVPSGGQGADETVSEAEAMKRYLLSKGIPESDILIEDKSTTTLENLLNSRQIIESREGRKYTALVTSNYHVYRALRYCRKIGFRCTGIGSHVAFYYWPSALIREFIAVHAEKKHAILFLVGWVLCMLFWTLIIFLGR